MNKSIPVPFDTFAFVFIVGSDYSSWLEGASRNGALHQAALTILDRWQPMPENHFTMGDESENPPESQGQPTTNANRKLLFGLIDSDEKLKLLRNFWHTEKKGLRDGWFATLITALIFAYFGYEHGTHSSDDIIKSQAATISSLSSTLQKDIVSDEVLNRELQDKSSDLLNATAERDKAQTEAESAKNALASWMMLAQSSNTNTPLTQRLDMLTQWVQRNTETLTNEFGGSVGSNLVSILESDEPTFGLYLNGRQVTNGLVLNLDEDKHINFRVINQTRMTAEQLSVIFMAPVEIGETNVLPDFSWTGNVTFSPADGESYGTNVVGYGWEWKADGNVAGGTFKNVNPISISPNTRQGIYTCMVEVFANRSKIEKFEVLLEF